MGYLKFLISFAGPFIALAILMMLWLYSAAKLEHRFPKYYAYSMRLYDYLPKIVATVVIVWLIYAFFTEPSYYDW